MEHGKLHDRMNRFIRLILLRNIYYFY